MNEALYSAIANYQSPQHVQALVSENPSLNITGPTGAGKGTLATYLAQSGKYAPVVSDTTRPPRPHNDGYEVNGVNYWFITEERALEKVNEGAYIEVKAVHQKTMYGTSIASYERVVNAGRTPILEIDVQGIEDLMQRFDGFEAIFLLPPDFQTWQARLDGRGRMDVEEKIQRLRSAVKEIGRLLENNRLYAVVNTEVVDTAELIISDEYKTEAYQNRALAIARDLLEKTQQFLSIYD